MILAPPSLLGGFQQTTQESLVELVMKGCCGMPGFSEKQTVNVNVMLSVFAM